VQIDLDHVALATRDARASIRTLVVDLSGLILFGGQSVGFRPMQILVGDVTEGMRVELLEPWRTDQNDFLERFLTRHGDGPHHLTFKVDDLDEALEEVVAAGVVPVNVDRSDPGWQEAFLMPADAHGTVVQLAASATTFPSRAAMIDHIRRHGPDGHPRWWPDMPASHGTRAFLDRVVMRTPDLDAATAFFSGLLRGEVENVKDVSVDLVWPGGARLRLVSDASAAPGIDHLLGRIGAPARALEIAGARFVLEEC
jgi:catechol 2,3-dioxygenase-like lactoylglutathione lyase family enzyme